MESSSHVKVRARLIDYYIYIDYSEWLIGYAIIANEQVSELIPKIGKLRHFKDVKYKKGYLSAAKRTFESLLIDNYLLKCRIMPLKDNLAAFVEVLDFVQKHDNCKIFASVDNKQFWSFVKLLSMIQHKDNITVVKESELKKGSVEYQMSLIIDTKLNIERLSKKTRQSY
ncbi:hypothetical protein HYY74_05200 [Candidatus Woesearchaeota archaeon]|nr:hypothetical protein [Candidatus Woesearchaeota archaeon]